MLKRITGSIVALSLVMGLTVLSFAGEVDAKTVKPIKPVKSGTIVAYTFGENG